MTYTYKGSAFILIVSTCLTLPAQSAFADTLSPLPDSSLRNQNEPAMASLSTTGIHTADDPRPSILPAVPGETALSTLTPTTNTVDPGPQSAPASNAPHKHYLRNLLIILGIGIGLPLVLLVTTDK